MYFLTTRPIWVLCLLALALTFLAMACPFIVRRFVTLERLTTNNEVAGFKFATMGVLYAVLLAFAVLVVWQRFNDAEGTVAAEAGAAATIYRLALAQGEPGAAVRQRLSDYLAMDVAHDWPEMQRGRTSQAGTDALTALYAVVLAPHPTELRDAAIQAGLLQQLGLLTQARRDRLVMAAGAVPGIIWLVLFTGAVLTITFTFFFGTINVRNQAVMTGALALLIFSVLVIVVAVDRPFAGPVQISAEPLVEVLHNFQRLPGH
jgi:Na+/proline symporter